MGSPYVPFGSVYSGPYGGGLNAGQMDQYNSAMGLRNEAMQGWLDDIISKLKAQGHQVDWQRDPAGGNDYFPHAGGFGGVLNVNGSPVRLGAGIYDDVAGSGKDPVKWVLSRVDDARRFGTDETPPVAPRQAPAPARAAAPQSAAVPPAAAVSQPVASQPATAEQMHRSASVPSRPAPAAANAPAAGQFTMADFMRLMPRRSPGLTSSALLRFGRTAQ